jgi:hypothetical protein
MKIKMKCLLLAAAVPKTIRAKSKSSHPEGKKINASTRIRKTCYFRKYPGADRINSSICNLEARKEELIGKGKT